MDLKGKKKIYYYFLASLLTWFDFCYGDITAEFQASALTRRSSRFPIQTESLSRHNLPRKLTWCNQTRGRCQVAVTPHAWDITNTLETHTKSTPRCNFQVFIWFIRGGPDKEHLDRARVRWWTLWLQLGAEQVTFQVHHPLRLRRVYLWEPGATLKVQRPNIISPDMKFPLENNGWRVKGWRSCFFF